MTNDVEFGQRSKSIKLGGPLKIPSSTRFYNRCYQSFLAFPKMFLTAFLWEGFGLGSGYPSETTRYYFITGLGGGVGIVVGHMLTYYVAKGKEFNAQDELLRAVHYGLAVFFGPSTLWQKVVNDTDEWGWSFTSAFFFMWLIAALMYYASMMAFRAAAELGSERFPALKAIDPASKRVWSDLSLSLSVGLGDAFFMGTCSDQFHHNWLSPAFGVDSGTSDFVAMLKSGTSELVGFAWMQMMENIILHTVWTDDAQEDAAASKQRVNSDPSVSLTLALTNRNVHSTEERKEGPTTTTINAMH